MIGILDLQGQAISSSASKPWHSDQENEYIHRLQVLPKATYSLDANHAYSLAELIDLGESHNPETRAAWQHARSEAQAVGVAQSSLFPTLTAAAVASTWRYGVLLGEDFHRQTVGLFQPTLNLNYLIFDFGQRSGSIQAAKAEMVAANFAFNDTHRKLIYLVTAGYYQLLNAIGQEDAAKATLLNAKTVEADAQSRLDHGLATIPDLLEAQAASAEADYNLQATIGNEEAARGDLATALGLPPDTPFQVQNIDEISIPDDLIEGANQAIERAVAQRPDLLQEVAKVRAAEASIKQADATYFPSLSLSGLAGLQHAYGQQDLLPGSYASGETWNVQMSLRWTLFDGAKREHAIAEAQANRASAQANSEALRDQISNEVWRAYSDAKTALRQRRAAAALLVSADRSYIAVIKAYDLGVRNLLDVVAAQRALAQARSADVMARTQVLTQMSNLAFRTGDLLRTPVRKAGP
jgi:outer membrane protein